VRPEWLSLNGAWEFAFDDCDVGLEEGWQDGRRLARRIVVPFPYQSRLSGIGDTGLHEVVWYARDVEVPVEWRAGTPDREVRDVLLHFGAVDYRTTVWLNGQEVGHNRGGHVPFSFDATPYLREGVNRLALRVEDRQNARQPRGKQSVDGRPRGIDYTCTTGIWQTVWLEPVTAMRIEELQVDAKDDDSFEVCVVLHAPSTEWEVEVELSDGEGRVTRASVGDAGAATRLRLQVPPERVRRWSPEDPQLYDVRVQLRQGGRVLDEVGSYAGLRTVRLRNGRFELNGEPLYLRMAMDQGYWAEGLLAAPSDAALREDVEWAKRLGFNGVRKHQKIEDPRWLYWCDRLGLLVWEEMPNARDWSPEVEEALLAEWERAVRRDASHACVITWVPVNESMGLPGLEHDHPGQYAFVERMVAATRRLDATRPVVDNDGWEHTDVTDVCALHDYTPTAAGLQRLYAETLAGGPLPAVLWNGRQRPFVRGARHRGQPVVLSEVGGFLRVPPGVPPEERDQLYRLYAAYETDEGLFERYAELVRGIAALPFVAGFCYTQLYDVEHELNGLLTYERRTRVDPEKVAALHAGLGSPREEPPQAQPGRG
jgi:beta-galactosidase/beta-glucuronidase